ncbi:MAG: hypothetical protein Q4D96_13735 [Propionibacteriaceae bacterium]|nr:hypothetical protein [Propionibacteriaceae bacterium]
MRAVRTQFDAGEFSGTVATPTCCSCCCCCCCVTTAATASIVGAGAAVVAGRRRTFPWWRKVAALLLGGVAPWLFLLPSLAAFIIPLSGSIGLIPLLGVGVLLLIVGYLILPLLLGRRHFLRVGAAAVLSVLVFGFLEAVVMFYLLIPFAMGDVPHGWPVFYGYLGVAVVLAVVLGRRMVVKRRCANCPTLAEVVAGVSPAPRPKPPRSEDSTGDD